MGNGTRPARGVAEVEAGGEGLCGVLGAGVDPVGIPAKLRTHEDSGGEASDDGEKFTTGRNLMPIGRVGQLLTEDEGGFFR